MNYKGILCIALFIALISVFPVSATEGKNLPSEEQIKTLCESVTDKDNYASNLFESAKEKGYVCDLWACESCKGEKLAISFYYPANNAKGYKSIYTSQPGEYKSYIPNVELKDSYTGEERTYSKNGPESSCADCKTDSDKNDTETKNPTHTYPVNSNLNWCGITWYVPAASSNTWVDDQNNLHMRLEKINDRWCGAVLESRNTVKYGKLTWVSNTPALNLERNTTFGLCTYYDDRNELDIEINQWPGYDEHVWFSKQPASVDNHPENISYGVFSSNPYLNDKNIVYSIEWTPNYVYYSVTAGDGTIIQDWTYSDPEGIPAINSTICMCLLPLAGSYYPASGNAAEVVLSSFTYTPYDPSWTESKQKPVASFSASPASGSAPLKVAFTDKSTGAPTSRNWNFGDGTSSTEKNPTHTYSKAGTYTATLKATNEAGGDTETKINYITAAESQIPSVPILENTVPNTNFEKRQGIDMGFDDLEKRIEFENESEEMGIPVYEYEKDGMPTPLTTTF